ncbi:hypothetical protein [Streptomyces djakartensis]|uniref:hypothetical protein n=1 Tax=Streptomyces djakartensis TaxID=68193 RepID=UPI001E3F392D|nr:hypothetical protein [Streptomyces djakartensis]
MTTRELSSDGRVRHRGATQVFAGSDVRATGGRLPAGTENLRGIPRQSEGRAGSPAPEAPAVPAVRDPWQEDAQPAGTAPPDDGPADAQPAGTAPPDDGPAEHTHDPHEVTVQLDAVVLGDGFLRQDNEGAGTPETAADRPVFVDESGRRSRRFRRIGMAVALACGVYAVVIVATLLSGNSNAPWLPVPGQKEDQPAGQVDTPPQPEQSAPSAGTGATTPGSTPTTDEVGAPSPGVSAGRPAAPAAPADAADPGRRGTTAKPSPTTTRTSPAPGTGVTDPTPSKPADPPATPATAPTPTTEPTPEPTVTTGTGDGGDTGPVANGPAEPQPVADDPAAQPQPVTESPAA